MKCRFCNDIVTHTHYRWPDICTLCADMLRREAAE